MSLNAAGLLVGLVAGLGLVAIAGVLLRTRRPALTLRVLPYVRDVPMSDTAAPSTRPDRASTALHALIAPLLDTSARRLGDLLGGNDAIRRRLNRAGMSSSVHDFRLSQIAWGLAGAGAVLVLGLLGPGRDPARALNWVLLAIGAFLAGVMARDHALGRAARRREQRMLTEFPVVADLLALSVAAGEGPIGALTRVADTCRGALPDELAAVLAETRTGVPVTAALDRLASRTDLPIVGRFAEGLAVAVDRGTPLVDLLIAQAADVREAARRQLIETGARKEVAMMVPVVFLIMPVTLLFAFFPGVVGLHLLVP